MLNTRWRCMLHLLAVCALTSPALAADKVLSVVATATGASTATAYPGQTVEVDIRVDDAAMVAGAAFTVTFDPANLALAKVSSTFFGAFANLGLSPSAVSFSPLITNPVTTGAMLAAARPDNGSGTQVPLFTLSFLVKGPFDNYPVSIPISISRSRISNTAAGFGAISMFDPKMTTAPGGIGYGPYDDDFWTIMIPAILNSGGQTARGISQCKLRVEFHA